MNNKLSELKAAALAATQGPWLIADENTPWNIEDATGQQVAISQQRTNTRQNPKQTDRTANAIFIAAANPAVFLALLAELDEAQKESVYFCNLNAQKDKRITELEAIATEYASKFQKAQDADKHLVIMNDSAQTEIANLKTLLATPVQASGWISWHGGMFRPVRSDTVIDVMFANGNMKPNICAGSVVFEWQKTPKDSQRVTAYRLHRRGG